MTLLVRAGSRLFIYLLIFLNLFERVMGTNVPCRPNFRLGMSGSAAFYVENTVVLIFTHTGIFVRSR